MAEDLYIPLILGTAREGRQSEHVARFVLAQMTAYEGIRTRLWDVREGARTATVPPWADDPATGPWQAEAARADGFVIVTPEYNHGYPGELKLFLDQALEEYIHKPLAVCGVSRGGFGGVRVIEALHLVALELGMVPTFAPVPFSRVRDLFDEDGAITDPKYEGRVRKMLDELVWMGRALKAGREADE